MIPARLRRCQFSTTPQLSIPEHISGGITLFLSLMFSFYTCFTITLRDAITRVSEAGAWRLASESLNRLSSHLYTVPAGSDLLLGRE